MEAVYCSSFAKVRLRLPARANIRQLLAIGQSRQTSNSGTVSRVQGAQQRLQQHARSSY